jgi:hypothetical protein
VAAAWPVAALYAGLPGGPAARIQGRGPLRLPGIRIRHQKEFVMNEHEPGPGCDGNSRGSGSDGDGRLARLVLLRCRRGLAEMFHEDIDGIVEATRRAGETIIALLELSTGSGQGVLANSYEVARAYAAMHPSVQYLHQFATDLEAELNEQVAALEQEENR